VSDQLCFPLEPYAQVFAVYPGDNGPTPRARKRILNLKALWKPLGFRIDNLAPARETLPILHGMRFLPTTMVAGRLTDCLGSLRAMALPWCDG
jgi:hypothetical protein